MSSKQKTHHDVKGWQSNCPNYEMCPLCYGCRAYNSSHVRCEGCADTKKKFHVCDTTKHRADLLSKMIKRETIEITGGTAYVL